MTTGVPVLEPPGNSATGPLISRPTGIARIRQRWEEGFPALPILFMRAELRCLVATSNSPASQSRQGSAIQFFR